MATKCIRPLSYDDWKSSEGLSQKIPAKFDLLRLPGHGYTISLTKLLGPRFGKTTETSPRHSPPHKRLAKDDKFVVSSSYRESDYESKNDVVSITSPVPLSPSQSSRMYVAGALHRLIESGEIPQKLSPAARKIYASESPASSPKGSKGPLQFNSSGRFDELLISPRSQSIHSDGNTPSELIRPFRVISRPQSASVSRNPASATHPSSALLSSPPINPGIYTATLSNPNDSRVELRPGSASTQRPPADAPTLRGSAALLSVHEALRFSFLARVLPPDCLLLVAQNSHTLACRAGHVLAMQGRRCDAAHVVVDGQLVLLATRHDANPPAQGEVGRIGGLGDCVSEGEILVGAASPHTVQCATPCRLVRVPVRAMQAAIRHAPHAAQLLAALADLNQHPASLLVKVCGLVGGPRAGQPATEPPAPALLEVGVVGGASGREVGGRAGERPNERAALLHNPQLAIDRLFEVAVAERDARVYVRLSAASRRPAGDGRGAGAGAGSKGGRFEPQEPVWEASLPFADVLRTRTLSADLHLTALGSSARAQPSWDVSVVCSARGLYTADEWGLLEWLGDGAADLPMLLRCGVRSLRDLEALGLSDLLAAMEAGGLAEPVRARLVGRFHAAKAAGPSFLGAYGRALAARILRFYRRPGAVSAPPGLSCGGTWRGPLEPRWTGHLFAGYADERADGPRDGETPGQDRRAKEREEDSLALSYA